MDSNEPKNDSKSGELPPYPTVGEIIAAVVNTAAQNLSQVQPHSDDMSSDHPA